MNSDLIITSKTKNRDALIFIFLKPRNTLPDINNCLTNDQAQAKKRLFNFGFGSMPSYDWSSFGSQKVHVSKSDGGSQSNPAISMETEVRPTQ